MDFLVVEESAAAVSSAVVAFLLLRLGRAGARRSVVVGVALLRRRCWRRVRFASTSSNATSSERKLAGFEFDSGEFLSPAAYQSFCLAPDGAPGAGSEVQIIAARFLLGELGK
jgi:hypothetical protein